MNTNREWFRIDRKKRTFEKYYASEFMKALFRQIDPILENFSFIYTPQQLEQRFAQVEQGPIREVFFDLYRRVGVEFMMDQAKKFKGEADGLKTKDIDIPEPTTAMMDPEAFVYLWTTEVNSWVLQNVGDRIVTITETTRKRGIQIVRNITKQAIDEGLSLDDTMRLLERQIPVEWRKERWRAETIARTEVLSASNEGSFRGARATGLPLVKTWLARLDGRERPDHRFANGQQVELNQPFNVGGQELTKPGDLKGSPENVINCRCVMTFEVKRQ